MTDQYVLKLVEAYPDISEVWLIGSRAKGTERSNSDWDYIAFATIRVMRSLRQRKWFNSPDVDLLIVYDGDHFAKPWHDDNRRKKGSLKSWGWQKTSTTQATYQATKFSEDENFISVGHAKRVWPSLSDQITYPSKGLSECQCTE